MILVIVLAAALASAPAVATSTQARELSPTERALYEELSASLRDREILEARLAEETAHADAWRRTAEAHRRALTAAHQALDEQDPWPWLVAMGGVGVAVGLALGLVLGGL